MNKEPVKMAPGDDLHLTLLMAPQSLNFVTGQDREHLLAYGRSAFEAGQASKCLHQIAEPAAEHIDDLAVGNLAYRMKAKLAKQRENGYGGWDTDCTQERLSELLRQHVDKGDPVDVANFCAFLLARGEGIAAAPQAVQPAVHVAHRHKFTDGHRTLKQDVFSAIHDYSATKPEQDHDDSESWESWFEAAFDLLGTRVGQIFEEHAERDAAAPAHPAEGAPAQVMQEELAQLGYQFKDGRMIPPEHVGELLAVVQDAPCGCQFGTCETKVDSRCRMKSEIAATQPAAQGLDAQMLNFINDKRIALTPEYEGPWKAEVFGDEAEPVITTEGNTVRDAVSAAIAAQAKQGGAA